MNRLLHEISLAVLPRIVAWAIKIVFITCRITIHGQQERNKVDTRKTPAIGTCWHYGIIGIFYVLRNESSVMMVSASDDGDYIAKLSECLGFSTVRGSRNRGGVQALKELLNKIRQGENLGIVADGSQGPPRVVQAGSILLASRTGAPILPMVWSTSRYFTINSWDRTVIPKLFSQIDFFYGEPLHVPKKLDSTGIEKYRLKLEGRLNSLYQDAWSRHGRKEH